MPKISILCPSFNREKYIGYFINSVLNQTFSDFELVIVDDCSTDNNVKEILKFKDSRIKLIQHDFNKGINATLNTAFENSSGEYIVFCASDDMLEKNALKAIHNALFKTSALAIYPALTMIDATNKKIEKIEHKKRNRDEMLHKIFMEGNCLTSPGMSMKREIFEKILYPLDNSICNLQDVQMHIKLLLHGDILLLDDYLILYRFDPRTSNISKKSLATSIRENLEISKIMDTFLEADTKLLDQVFTKEIGESDITPKAELTAYFLGRMALKSDCLYRQMWGYHKIMDSYNTKEKANILKKEYGFEFKEYLDLISKIDINSEKKIDILRKKYKKYKRISLVTILLLFGIVIAWSAYEVVL